MRILTIETSIKKDIASEVGRFLLENDFEYEEAGDNKESIYENSILALCNALDKIVLPKHYKVHYSKELLYKMNNQFDEQLNNLIKLFETKFREGHKVVLSQVEKFLTVNFMIFYLMCGVLSIYIYVINLFHLNHRCVKTDPLICYFLL